MNHNNRFFDGLIIGLILGGAAVFLLGTKSGKNLLKILSEQGWEGISDLMDQYGEGLDEEDLDVQGPIAEENAKEDLKEREVSTDSTNLNGEEKPPKKRFFKRIRS